MNFRSMTILFDSYTHSLSNESHWLKFYIYIYIISLDKQHRNAVAQIVQRAHSVGTEVSIYQLSRSGRNLNYYSFSSVGWWGSIVKVVYLQHTHRSAKSVVFNHHHINVPAFSFSLCEMWPRFWKLLHVVLTKLKFPSPWHQPIQELPKSSLFNQNTTSFIFSPTSSF